MAAEVETQALMSCPEIDLLVRFPTVTRSLQLSMRWTTVRQYAQLTKEKLVSRTNASVKVRPDPFSQVAPELAQIKSGLVSLLGAGHPALDQVAKYYFSRPSKHLRPLLILLFSQATNGLGTNWSQKLSMSHGNGAGGSLDALDRAFTRPDVLNDWNPSLPDKTSQFNLEFSWHPPSSYFEPPLNSPMRPISLLDPPVILPTQIRLAQIVEMIHAASLLHDDVIDQSAIRRGAPSAPVAFGSKFAVLGGDFILGRASSALARLGDPEVIELIATVIANLVEGEILQMKDAFASDPPSTPSKSPWVVYMQKTYLKTASLMAKGARGAAVLGGCMESDVYRDIAYSYGRDLGLAFQVSPTTGCSYSHHPSPACRRHYGLRV